MRSTCTGNHPGRLAPSAARKRTGVHRRGACHASCYRPARELASCHQPHASPLTSLETRIEWVPKPAGARCRAQPEAIASINGAPGASGICQRTNPMQDGLGRDIGSKRQERSPPKDEDAGAAGEHPTGNRRALVRLTSHACWPQ